MPTAQPVRFTDVCKSRFSGSASQDFVDWMNDFEIAANLQEGLSDRQRVNLLQAMMEGNCRRVAADFTRTYQERHAEPAPGHTHAQNRARDDYWRTVYQQLVEHLKGHSTIVGTDPGTRLMTKWRDLAQRPDEGVRAYSHRVDELVERLAAQEPPIPIAPRDAFVTFVNGLSEPIRMHVESQCAKTKDKALELAEAHENAHRLRPGAAASSSNTPRPAAHKPAQRPAAAMAPVSANDYRPYIRPTYGATQQANSVGAADQPQAPATTASARKRDRQAHVIRRLRGELAAATCMATAPAAITPELQPHSGRGPGTMNQICLSFLRNQKCRFGDKCYRLHVHSLDQNQDVRPNVKTRVAEEAKHQARELIAKYPNGPPRAGEGDRNVRPKPEPVHRVFMVREPRPAVGGQSNGPTQDMSASVRAGAPPQSLAEERPSRALSEDLEAARRLLRRLMMHQTPWGRLQSGQLSYHGLLRCPTTHKRTLFYQAYSQHPNKHLVYVMSQTSTFSATFWLHGEVSTARIRRQLSRRSIAPATTAGSEVRTSPSVGPASAAPSPVVGTGRRHDPYRVYTVQPRPRVHQVDGPLSGTFLMRARHALRKVPYRLEPCAERPLNAEGHPQMTVVVDATAVGLELPAIFWMTASLAREPRWVKCFFLLLYGLRVEAAAEAARQQRRRQSQPAPDHADSSDAPTGESEDEMVMMVTQARTKARHTKTRPRPKLSPVRMFERITNLDIDGERWDTEIKAHDIAGQPDKLRLTCTERRVCKPGEDEEYMTWSVTTSRARAEEPGGVLKAFAAALDQAGVRRTDPNAFNFVDSGHSGKDAGVLAPPSSPRRPSADTAITRGLSMPSEPKRLFADSVDEFEAFWDDEIKYPFLD